MPKKKTRAQKMAASEKSLKEIKARWDIKTSKPKPKPKPKPKKKSWLQKAKAILRPKPYGTKPKPKPTRPKKQKKTTWPSGITSQKAFEELMQIKRKKKKK